MTSLPRPGSSIPTYQQYVKKVLGERGFDDETITEKYMLFVEEVGELARAIRKHAGVKMASDTSVATLLDEAGDVLILYLDLCNQLGIDAEEALLHKEKKNSKRTWS